MRGTALPLLAVPTPPKRILIGHKRLTGLDERIRAARPDLEVRSLDLGAIGEAELAWADCYVGFRRPEPELLGGVTWMHCTGAGVEAFLARPLAAEITITRTSEDFGPQIAEYCVARALAITQQLRHMDAAQRARQWQPEHPRPMAGGRTLIIGTGQVGRAVSRAFGALGCPAHGVSRSGAPAVGFPAVSPVSRLPDLVGEADWIVLCAPLTAETRGLFSAALMARCRGAVLMNVGRGALADESALPAALDAGWLRAAVLDVFEVEPLPAESPLWARDDVYLTPHISGLTTASGAALGFLECLATFERGEPTRWLVDRARGY